MTTALLTLEAALAEPLKTVAQHRTYASWRAGYQRMANVDAAAVTVDPVAPFALPVGHAPARSVAPAFLNCPRAWLPPELVDQRTTRAPSAATRLRAAAATVALSASGLWRPDHGFTSIGRRYGIQFSDPDEAARTAWWQRGARDRRLDNVERDVHRAIRSNCSVRAAELLMPLARSRQREIATMLLHATHEVAAQQDPRRDLRMILDIALDTLGDLRARSVGTVADELRVAAALIRAHPGAPDRPLSDRARDDAVAHITAALWPHAERSGR